MTAKEMYGKMKKGTVTKKEVYKFIDSEMSKVPKNKRQDNYDITRVRT